MNLNEISVITSPRFKYGDVVILKNAESTFKGCKGKIIDLNSITAKVKFEGTKSPVLVMLNALELYESN